MFLQAFRVSGFWNSSVSAKVLSRSLSTMLSVSFSKVLVWKVGLLLLSPSTKDWAKEGLHSCPWLPALTFWILRRVSSSPAPSPCSLRSSSRPYRGPDSIARYSTWARFFWVFHYQPDVWCRRARRGLSRWSVASGGQVWGHSGDYPASTWRSDIKLSLRLQLALAGGLTLRRASVRRNSRSIYPT